MVAVALVALSTLFFEVLLTRIFSVTLWYHFGFLSISLALLGAAASAVLCYLYPEFLAGDGHLRNLAISASLFSVTAPGSVIYHVSTQLPGFENAVGFYAAFGTQLILLFFSFFFAGLCISIALFRYAEQVGTVYSFDLIGASLGSLLVVPLMYRWSPISLVFVVSSLGFVAALFFVRATTGRSAAQMLLGLGAVAGLVIASVNDSWHLFEVHTIKSYARSGLQKQEGEKLFEKWSPVSRVAVRAGEVHLAIGPALMATNDAGAPTVLPRFDGDYEAVQPMLGDPLLASFRLKENAEVLIVGVGGGRDVLAALASNQKRITAVEINPIMGDLVTRHFADYIGRIFEDPRVTLHIQEGRNFVAGSDDRYDIILFSMIDSWSSAAAAGAYVFNENSLYTIEAIHDFMTHLEPDGILSMTRYFAWNEALRLTNLFAQYLDDRGIDDVGERIMVVRNRLKRPNAVVLLKNGRFTREEAETMLEIARRSDSMVLHAPHLTESELAPSELSGPFRAIVNPGALGKTREQIVDQHPRDISAPTDDRPFFFYTKRPLDLFRFDPREHAARRLALPLLYGMAVVFGAIALITVFLPLYLRSRAEIREAPQRVRSLVYFAMLGAGFMLIEISLIQRLTIFLGHPTWSFVVVLAAILFSSGLGSLFSARWPDPNPRVLCAVLAGIVALVFFYAVVVYDQFIELMWLGKSGRILVSVVTIAPVGFLMGMCFPMGIQIVRRFHATLVPWGWGVNGAFSVFASVFSIVLAVSAGFKAGMFVGIGCYAVALLITASLARDAAGPVLRGGRHGRPVTD